MEGKQHSDFWAALTGLIVGGCFVFAILFGVVVLTNHHYAGEKTPAPVTR